MSDKLFTQADLEAAVADREERIRVLEAQKEFAYNAATKESKENTVLEERIRVLEAQKRHAQDELILRHRCTCEVCIHSWELCPASASSLAMEQTTSEQAQSRIDRVKGLALEIKQLGISVDQRETADEILAALDGETK